MLSPIQSNIVVPNTRSGRTIGLLNLDATKGREGDMLARGQGDTRMREGTCWQVDTLTREAKKPCKGANRSGAPVQKCKSERGEAARGHVDKVTRGQALARGGMGAR